MNRHFTRARAWLRHGVWWMDCVAATLGWLAITGLAVGGFSLMIVGYLLSDFFTHYVNAASEARASFHLIAAPILAAAFALTAALRWHSRALLIEPAKGRGDE